MGRDFILDNGWYYDCLFKRSLIEINPGVTVLVGCNGAGKTSTIRQIQHSFIETYEENDYVSFNNLWDGGSNSTNDELEKGNNAFVARAAISSEGENIMYNLNKAAIKMGEKSNELLKNGKEQFWIFLDAVDSGMSIDNIVEVKEFLHFIVDNCNSDGLETYVIVAANSYEMAHDENCFDVQRGKYISFTSYEEYRKFILNSRKLKESMRK